MAGNLMNRRRVLKGFGAACVVAPLAGRAYSASLGYDFTGPAADRELGLQPPASCTAGTRSTTAGPFYTPSTPRRANLIEPGANADSLVLEGLVLDSDCRPIAGAVVDIWHCDETGRYDNRGYRYRGHQFTDSAGSYRFTTIRPGDYTGRTEHIHVKVQGPGTRVLTTQLYFPDRAQENSSDWIFKSSLVMDLKRTDTGWRGSFDFII